MHVEMMVLVVTATIIVMTMAQYQHRVAKNDAIGAVELKDV